MHRYIFTVLHILTKFVRKETQNMAYSILDMSPNCCSQFGLYDRAHFRDSNFKLHTRRLLNVYTSAFLQVHIGCRKVGMIEILELKCPKKFFDSAKYTC